jgi:hypothetical protein
MDIMEYVRVFREHFPCMCLGWDALIAIPLSNAGLESCFNYAGMVDGERRGRLSTAALETQTITRLWRTPFRQYLGQVVAEWISTPAWTGARETSDDADDGGPVLLPVDAFQDDDPDDPFPRTRGQALVDDGSDTPGLVALTEQGTSVVVGSVEAGMLDDRPFDTDVL